MKHVVLTILVALGLTLLHPAQASAASTITGTNWYPVGPAPIVNAQTYPTPDRIDATGRATVIAVNPANPNDVYIGTATGGVWRSRDGGQTWKPFEELTAALEIGAAPLSIGALKVDGCGPDRCDLVYAGTGENSRRRDTYWGAGLLIGEWGGAPEFPSFSWQLSGGSEFKYGSINDILLDPTTSGSTKRLHVAVSSGVTASASESTVTAPSPPGGYGLYTSGNNGGSWNKLTVAGSDNAKPTDLEMDPQETQRLFAGFDGRGIFLSTNNGGDWCPLNPGIAVSGCPPASGLPIAGSFDFVEIAVHRPVASSSTVLYAMFGNCTSKILDSCSPPIYRSNNGGASWVQVISGAGAGYSRYTHTLVIHPSNPDIVYYGGINLYRLDASALPATPIAIGTRTIHPDHHDLVFPVPSDPNRVYGVNDGGFYYSSDAGSCWNSGNDGLQITGFQSMTSSPLTARVIGGTQDNGTNMWAGTRVWQHLTDSDSASTTIDSATAQTMYDVQYQVAPRRTTSGPICCNWGSLLSSLLESAGHSAFYPPFIQVPGGSTLYFGADALYRRESGSSTWTLVSFPPPGGGTVFADIETPDTITAVAAAPSDHNRIYIGYYNGQIWRTRSGGACGSESCWTNVTAAVMPTAPVTRIAVHPSQPGIAYATFSGFAEGPHVFRTDSNGSSWQPKASGLPSGLPVNTLHIETNDTGRLWLGTDAGVYKSTNGGNSWAKFSNGLPNVPVYEISLDESRGRVWAGTHGRGAFVLTEPNVSNYEGWVNGSIWDVPVYGTGWPGSGSCTMRLVRQDGTICAEGTTDAQGGSIRTVGGVLGTSLGGFYIDRPVAWACFNGKCVGPTAAGTDISVCNQPGNPLTSVEVECGGITGIDLITGCPQQANPPTSVLGLSSTNEGAGTPTDVCLPAAGSGGGAPMSGAPSESAAALQLLHVTPTLQVGDGSTRTLCTVAVGFQVGESRRVLTERVAMAINASTACGGVGVSAEVFGLGEEPWPGIEDPAPKDPRLVLSGPALTGSHLITSLHAAPGDGDGLCFDLGRLGNPILNQLEIVRLRFQAPAGGVEGGAIRVVETTPLGRCDITVDLAAGDSAIDVATKVANAFQAPGIPGPNPRCPSRRNARDISLHGDSVISVASLNLALCIDDAKLGFFIDPEEVDNRHPAANAGGNRIAPDPAAVVLDGSGSTDPDSTPGTADDIVSFEWFEVSGAPVALGSGKQLTVPLSAGTHLIRLRVIDSQGLVDTAEAVVSTQPGSRLSARVHLSQAYAATQDFQLFGIPTDGTTDYRRLALGFTYTLNPQDRIVAQLSHVRAGESPLDGLRDDVELDWGFYEHAFANGTRLRAGRAPMPHGIYNEIRDVGVLHSFFNLPTSVYQEGGLSLTSETVDGLSVLHPFVIPGPWSVDLAVWLGGWDKLELTPDTSLASEARSQGAVGFQLWIGTPFPGLKVGVAGQRYDLKGGLMRTAPTDTWKTWLFSVDGSFGSWMARGEYILADHPLAVSGLSFSDVETEGWYAQVGFTPIPKLSLAAQVDRLTSKFLGTPDFKVDLNRDYALSVGWAFRPEIVLRIEFHRNEGYLAEDANFDLFADASAKDSYGLVSLAVSF